ncbi:alpha/beta hydrolase [Nocardia sp. NPDC006630]|uniref:alpha/beta fold hydrolase n=1 Tax=Nocardia sp. NPDC006630 TaxID=3157181 RepID=UPI00339F8629
MNEDLSMALPGNFPLALAEAVLGPRPEGRPDKMRRLGDTWSSSADTLRTVADSYTQLATALRSSGSGATIDQLAASYESCAADTTRTADACDSFAEQTYDGANSIDLGQLTWDGMAVVTVAQLIADAMLLNAGAVKAVADRAAAREGWRRFLVQLLDRLSGAGVTFTVTRRGLLMAAAAQGAGVNTLVATGAQLVQEAQGHRSHLDGQSIVTAAVSGGFGGLGGAALAHAVAPALSRFMLQRFSTPARATIGSTLLLGGLGGVGGAVTGSLASAVVTGIYTGHLPSLFDREFLSGMAGGLIGGALGGTAHAVHAGFTPRAHESPEVRALAEPEHAFGKVPGGTHPLGVEPPIRGRFDQPMAHTPDPETRVPDDAVEQHDSGDIRAVDPHPPAPLGPDVIERLQLLHDRTVTMQAATMHYFRAGRSPRTELIEDAQSRINQEMERLRSTGTVIRDVPIIAGPDNTLALKWLFEPKQAYPHVVGLARTALAASIVERGQIGPWSDRAQETLRAAHRMLSDAAAILDPAHPGDLFDLTTLAAAITWTDQDPSHQLVDPDGPDGIPRPSAELLASIDPGETASPHWSDIADHTQLRAIHASIESRREASEVSVRGYRAALDELPDSVARQLPEPKETTDLGYYSTLHATQMPDGRRVDIRILGDPHGYPLVLSPGTPVGVDGLLPNANILADRGFALIVVERPGYGNSTPLPGRSVSDCARDISYVMTELLAVDKYGAIGRSGGGMVTYALGSLDPEHCERVVTVGGTAPVPGDLQKWISGMGESNRLAYTRPQGGENSELSVAERRAALAQRGLETVRKMSHDTAGDGGSLIRTNADSYARNDYPPLMQGFDAYVRGYERALRVNERAWTDDSAQLTTASHIDFTNYRVPVDVVQGLNDPFTPPAHGTVLAGLVRTARLHLLPEVSHMMAMDVTPVATQYFRAERDAYLARPPATESAHLRNAAKTASVQIAESLPLPLPDWAYLLENNDLQGFLST